MIFQDFFILKILNIQDLKIKIFGYPILLKVLDALKDLLKLYLAGWKNTVGVITANVLKNDKRLTKLKLLAPSFLLL